MNISQYTKPITDQPTRHLQFSGIGHVYGDCEKSLHTFLCHISQNSPGIGRSSGLWSNDENKLEITNIYGFCGVESLEFPQWQAFSFVTFQSLEDATTVHTLVNSVPSRYFGDRTVLARYASLWEEVKVSNGNGLGALSSEGGDALEGSLVYSRAPTKVQCEWGSKCKRKNPAHFVEMDHPDDHPEIGQPVPVGVNWDLPSVCRHFHRLGFCIYGDACRFEHPEQLSQNRTDNVTCNDDTEISTAAQRRELFSSRNGCCDVQPKRNRGAGKRNRVRKSNRASSFRRFLLDTFGEDQLRSGTGVLDVAGGKGELSFELLNLNRVPATVVDPRQMKLGKASRRLKHGIYYRSEMFRKYVSSFQSVEGMKTKPTLVPAHYQTWFIPELWDPTAEQTDFSWNAEFRKEKIENYLREFKKSHGNNDSIEETDISFVEVMSSLEREKLRHIMRECSIVVGMHPDMATEMIVDFALFSGKPFAVVPCCVYSNLFPHRRLKNGEIVRSYTEFIEYICNKSELIQQAALDFEGKNIVLYHL